MPVPAFFLTSAAGVFFVGVVLLEPVVDIFLLLACTSSSEESSVAFLRLLGVETLALVGAETVGSGSR